MILDAGFRCFGELGYKKASTADLAKAAGISKAMIFHYFGTKKEMYLYLVETAVKEVSQAIAQGKSDSSQDFFDKVIQMSRDKMAFLKKFPSLMSFLISVYEERDPEVIEELQGWQEQGDVTRKSLMLNGIDRAKFKDTVDPELTLELLIGYSMGMVGQLTADRNGNVLTEEEMDVMLQKITACMKMLKVNFYKEEYL